MKAVVVLSTLLLAATATAAEDLMQSAQGIFKPLPNDPPTLKDNPVTPEKVALGAMLYFDPRLSKSHSISCNNCHQIGLGGADGLPTSIGHHWQRGGRNAPTVLNAVFNLAQFWDGRASDLKEQAGGPIQNPIEMAITGAHAVEMLNGIPGYRKPFEAAFPGQPDPISLDNATAAIAAFEATLITPDAPFDQYLRGDPEALSAQQKEGLALFIGKGCARCHNGINVGGGEYETFGVVERPGAELLPPGDKGRFMVTKTPSDEFVFKVPSLRNIELTAPYFHSGKAWDLHQAVAVMGASQLGIELSDEEVGKITPFLGSLTGKQPQVVYPILPPSTATTPQPET